MYIEYNRDVLGYLKSQELIDSLDHAATAMKEGNHIICTEKDEMALIISDTMSTISKKVASCFRKLYDSYSTFASVRKQVCLYIKIVPGCNICVREGACIKVSIDKTSKSAFWQRTNLILEHSDEAQYYESIIKQFNFDICPNYTATLGGGSTIAEQLDNYNNGFNIVLCISDSDKRCPGPIDGQCRINSSKSCTASCLGKTARDLIDAGNRASAICHVEILKVREIENLFFSKEILHDLAENDATKQNIAYALELAEAMDPNIWSIFDVKSGFLFQSIRKNIFLKNVFSYSFSACSNMDNNTICSKCVSCLQCDASSEYIMPLECKKHKTPDGIEKNVTCRNCSSIVVRGLGKQYLRDLFERNFMTRISLYFESFPQYLKDEWRRIAYIIVSWCCGEKLEVLGA